MIKSIFFFLCFKVISAFWAGGEPQSNGEGWNKQSRILPRLRPDALLTLSRYFVDYSLILCWQRSATLFVLDLKYLSKLNYSQDYHQLKQFHFFSSPHQSRIEIVDRTNLDWTKPCWLSSWLEATADKHFDQDSIAALFQGIRSLLWIWMLLHWNNVSYKKPVFNRCIVLMNFLYFLKFVTNFDNSVRSQTSRTKRVEEKCQMNQKLCLTLIGNTELHIWRKYSSTFAIFLRKHTFSFWERSQVLLKQLEQYIWDSWFCTRIYFSFACSEYFCFMIEEKPYILKAKAYLYLHFNLSLFNLLCSGWYKADKPAHHNLVVMSWSGFGPSFTKLMSKLEIKKLKIQKF